MMENGGDRNRRPGMSGSERKGLLLLVPLIIVVSVVLYFVKRPQVAEPVVAGAADPVAAATREPAGPVDSADSADSVRRAGPFRFDPNTATFRDFLDLGLSKSCAAGIIKYRERGKVFAIKEDFATCYGLGEDDYFRLEPYIVIGEEFRVKKFDRTSGRPSAPVKEKAVHADEDGEDGEPALIEINRADSAALRSVSGIGAYTVVEIMRYRSRLGGFAGAEQLREVRGMKDDNFERIYGQIWVDSCEIRKIDVNFATQQQIHATLMNHPYAGAAVVRKLLKIRQLKGGWRNIGDMVEDEIVTQEQAGKLAPYLVFR